MGEVDREYALLVSSDEGTIKAVRAVFTRIQSRRRVELRVADSIERAAVLVRREPPEALILDAVIGEKESDFVKDFQTMLPHSNILLLSEQPETCAPLISRELSLRFLPKPFIERDLQAVLLALRHPNWQDEAPKFEVHLVDVQLVDVLQLKLNCGRAARLEVIGPHPDPGVIDISNGRIVAASLGSLEGPEAFFQIVRWNSGSLLERPVVPVQQNIFIAAGKLLLEAAAIADRSEADLHRERGSVREATRRITQKSRLLDAHEAETQDGHLDFDTTPKILIIEDNPFLLSFLEVIIGDTYPGHIILSAPTGADGIECALLYHPKLIILDRTLPDASGEFLYGKLRKQYGLEKIPVIVTSGREFTAQEWRVGFPGEAAFLKKPFSSSELSMLLAKLLPISEASFMH